MILGQNNPILRKKSENVTDFGKELQCLIDKMANAMFAEPDGIGIAAPQIGESKKIFLVAEDVLHPERFYAQGEEKKRGFFSSSGGESQRTKKYLVFINPALKNKSSKKVRDIEGCLSVRGLYGDVARPEKVTIEYFDETGHKKSRGASGLFARVIQHEMDHLEGILFIDKASKIQNYESRIKAINI